MSRCSANGRWRRPGLAARHAEHLSYGIHREDPAVRIALDHQQSLRRGRFPVLGRGTRALASRAVGEVGPCRMLLDAEQPGETSTEVQFAADVDEPGEEPTTE